MRKNVLLLGSFTVALALSTSVFAFAALHYRDEAIGLEKHGPGAFATEIVRRDAKLPMFGPLDKKKATLVVRDWIYRNIRDGTEKRPGAPFSIKYALLGTPKGTMLCGGAAQAFHWALSKLSIPSRTVQLAGKDFLDQTQPGTTHVTVEVYLDGRWQISDPYFNASFKCNGEGKTLSVPEAAECVRKAGTLTPVQGKSEISGRSVATYPTNYEDFFAAYVRQPSTTPYAPQDSYPYDGWLKDVEAKRAAK